MKLCNQEKFQVVHYVETKEYTIRNRKFLLPVSQHSVEPVEGINKLVFFTKPFGMWKDPF